jgi:hypothetical protein
MDQSDAATPPDPDSEVSLRLASEAVLGYLKYLNV